MLDTDEKTERLGEQCLPPQAPRHYLMSLLARHIVQQYRHGHLSRRQFLHHAARIGLLTALPARAAITGKPGATIRVASQIPAGAMEPLTVSEIGGLVLLCQTGEFLIFDGPDLILRPSLALTWTPNADCSVWTFTLRPGVTFHDGQAFNAACVVATMDRLSDPKQGSNALSVLRGVLSPGGTKRIDDLTVRFELDAPNGNFPFYVSSDNYNAIMLPADYAGDFEANFNGTGPFRLDRYTAKLGVNFVRNEAYWGAKALPARTEFSFFNDQQPQILALEDDQVDVIVQISVQGAQGLLRDPDVKIIDIPASTHRQIHLRCDEGPTADPRVREAIALTLDRPGLIHGLFQGRSRLGNDSPFAPIYPATDPNVPQRAKNIPKARALMQAAGHGEGFAATLTTERVQEIPDLAVLFQNACAEIGIRVELRIEDPAAYYGTAQFGRSDWLDSTIGITDYGHRGVPNVTLAAPYLSNGAWNAAHFKNPGYDRLVAAYLAAVDLPTQRDIAGKIQTLLLEQTPILIPYFYDYLCATGPKVTGVAVSGLSQIFLQNAALS
jgi:peptide/nickel transport system substrate-binding protein